MYQFFRKSIFQQITVALETKFHQSTPQCNIIVHPVSEWNQDYHHYSVYIFTILEKKYNRKVISFTTMALAMDFFFLFSSCVHLPFAMHLVAFFSRVSSFYLSTSIIQINAHSR